MFKKNQTRVDVAYRPWSLKGGDKRGKIHRKKNYLKQSATMVSAESPENLENTTPFFLRQQELAFLRHISRI